MPLKITVRAVLPVREPGDVIVVGVPRTASPTNTASKKKSRSPLDGIDRALGGALGRQIKRDEFKGKSDQQLTVGTAGRIKPERVFLVGIGAIDQAGAGEARTFAAKAARAANAAKAKRLVLGVPAELAGRLQAIVEGLELGAYRFTKYMTGDRVPKTQLEQVTICVPDKLPADVQDAVTRGQTIGTGVNLARDLSNEPPNVLFPEALAAAATTMSKETGLKALHFDYKEIQRRGMQLIQAVGQGSANKPCMVHMSWTPPNAKRRLVFVGKGITFDSGGLSIKPAAGMGEMKHDMSGAANVVGLMQLVGRLKPDVEVHGIVAAAENMPDGAAYRPADIFKSLDGKTVEIINTDAEGRLILADALAYARTLEPDLLIDNATLTGACVVALGNGCSGWYAANERTAGEFEAAVKASGESMWRLPLLEELKDQLRSDSADLKHTGDRWGGSISAAMFLREFVGGSDWIHCDIAGPAMGDRVRGWDPKGGTGHGVLTFVQLIEASSRMEGKVKPLPAGTTDGVKKSKAEGPVPKRAAKARRASARR